MKKAKIETAENVNGETVVIYAPFTCTKCGKATHDLVNNYTRNGVNVVPAGHNWCGDCLRKMFPKGKLPSMEKAAKKVEAKKPVVEPMPVPAFVEPKLKEFVQTHAKQYMPLLSHAGHSVVYAGKRAVGSDLPAGVVVMAASKKATKTQPEAQPVVQMPAPKSKGDKAVSEKLANRLEEKLAEMEQDIAPAKAKKPAKKAANSPQGEPVPADIAAIIQNATAPKTAFVGIEDKPAPEPKAKKQSKPRAKVEKNETLKFTVSSDDTIVYEMNGLTTDRTTWRAAATRYQQRLLRRAEKAIRQRAAANKG